MDEYQELFNKITKEMVSKRQELTNLKEKLDKSSNRYNQLTREITTIEDTLNNKKEKLETMFIKNNNKIFYKIYLPGLLLSLISSFIIAFFIVKLAFDLVKTYTFIHISIGVLSGILVMLLASIPGCLITKKIYQKKIKQSKDIIILSPEYQKLLKEIKILETNLSIKKSLQTTEKQTINDTKIKCNIVSTEINMKETLLKYLQLENHNKSHNTIPEQDETKVHTKTRKKY